MSYSSLAYALLWSDRAEQAELGTLARTLTAVELTFENAMRAEATQLLYAYSALGLPSK